MNYLRSRLLAYFLRSFQKDLNTITGQISKEERDKVLSGWYQNPFFRNYLHSRSNAIALYMANEGKKPSDDEYQVAYGRRLELLDLLNTARIAYNKRQRELAEAQKKDSASQQASA